MSTTRRADADARPGGSSRGDPDKEAARIAGGLAPPGHRRLAWPMLAPALLIVAAVVALPVLRVLWLSVHETSLIRLDQEFVGLANFRAAIGDPALRQAMWVTGAYTLFSVGLSTVFGLALALALDRLPAGWRWLQGVFIAPWATSAVVVAFLFLYMFDVQVGVLNELMVRLGVLQDYVSWVGDTTLAFVAVTVATVWQMTPFFMLMFLAGLQAIPRSVLDAAMVDGATGLHVFRHITLPYLRGILVIAVTLMGIRTLNNFPIIWTMTQGGPVRSTTTTVILIYRQAFQQFEIGEAAAVSVIWLVVVLVLATFYARRVLTGQPT